MHDHEDISDYALRLARRRVLSYESLANVTLVDDLANILSYASERTALLPGHGAPAPQTPLDEIVGRADDDR